MRALVLAVGALSVAGCFTPESEGLTGAGSGGLNGAGSGSTGSTGSTSNGFCSLVTVVDPGNSEQPAGACICTRRDLVPAGNCPRGSGQVAFKTIGREGGSVTLKGSQGAASGVSFDITIPAGALDKETLITVTETTVPPPPGMVDWSPVYKVEPVGLMLAVPARLTVPFSQGRGSSYGGGTLFWTANAASPCSLERLPSSYTNAGFNQANVGILGYAISGVAKQGSATYCL